MNSVVVISVQDSMYHIRQSIERYRCEEECYANSSLLKLNKNYEGGVGKKREQHLQSHSFSHEGHRALC